MGTEQGKGWTVLVSQFPKILLHLNLVEFSVSRSSLALRHWGKRAVHPLILCDEREPPVSGIFSRNSPQGGYHLALCVCGDSPHRHLPWMPTPSAPVGWFPIPAPRWINTQASPSNISTQAPIGSLVWDGSSTAKGWRPQNFMSLPGWSLRLASPLSGPRMCHSSLVWSNICTPIEHTRRIDALRTFNIEVELIREGDILVFLDWE